MLLKMMLLLTCFMLVMIYNKSKAADTKHNKVQQTTAAFKCR